MSIPSHIIRHGKKMNRYDKVIISDKDYELNVFNHKIDTPGAIYERTVQ
jgi:hypothetical protein